jgi:hypothetical protein
VYRGTTLPKDLNIHASDLLQLEEKGQSGGGTHRGIGFELEYLDEFEFIFETLSGNHQGCNWWICLIFFKPEAKLIVLVSL